MRRGQLQWFVAVGLVGGCAGVAFVGVLDLMSELLGPDARMPVAQIPLLAGVGLCIGVAAHTWGTTGGVDLLVDNIHVLGGHRERRGLWTLVPSALLGIAAGGALGPEAPLVESTGAMGTAVAGRLGWSRPDVRVLTITGMAAGFSVLFGAPIGAAVFALEILHREGLEYYEALIPALIGAVTGLVVFELAASDGLFQPIWHLPTTAPATIGTLVPVVVISLVGVALGGAFVASTRAVRRITRSLPGWLRPAIGGAAIGLLALWSPYALTFGEHQLDGLMAPTMGIAALLAAVAAKLLASAICAATGWKGGFIIPLFFVGAAAGQAAHVAFPTVDAALLVACAMVAACVSVTKTPLGSTLVVAGTTGFALAPMLLIAALIAFVLSRPVAHFASQRSRPDAVSAGTDVTGGS